MRNKGFTLIELIVVIAIIGILASMLVPQVSKSIEKSRIAKTVAELRSIQDAMDTYLIDVGSYPPSIQDWRKIRSTAWGADVGLVERSAVHTNHLASWNGPYLKDWPKKTAWGGIVGCGAQGAYYIHQPIGWINRDGVSGNDYWIHMNPNCVRYPTQMAIEFDKVIDDGVAGTGNMRLTGGSSQYVYLYVGEGTRSW